MRKRIFVAIYMTIELHISGKAFVVKWLHNHTWYVSAIICLFDLLLEAVIVNISLAASIRVVVMDWATQAMLKLMYLFLFDEDFG